MDDQRRADRAATDGELFRLLVENVVDYAIFVVDPGGLVQTWSHGAERLLGYREDEIVGRAADVFYTPEDRRDQVPQQERREALATGRGDDDRWHVRKDGSRLWVSGVMTPLRDQGGDLRGFAKIMRDRTEWWHAEQARRDAEERHRSILESITDAFFAVDRDWRFTYVNRQAEHLLGRRPGDLIGKSLWDEYPGLAGSEFERAYHRAVDEQVATSVTSFYPDHNRWYEIRTYPAKDGLSVYLRDMTDDRRRGQALRESEERLRFTLDATNVGQWDLNLLTDTATRSLRHDQIFGYDSLQPEWGYDLFLNRHVHPEDRAELDRAFREAAGGGKDWEAECRIVRADGAERWIWVRSGVYLTENGKPIRMLGLVLDITDRKRAEERVRFQARLLDTVGQAVILTNPQGTITYWNRFAETLYGWRADEALGRNILEIVVAEGFADRAEEVMACMRSGKGWSGEFTVRHRDGATFPAFVTDTPVFDGRGELEAIVSVSMDVTSRKRAEEQLREQTRIAEALNRIGVLLAAELDLERLVQVVTDEATRLTDARFGAFFYNVPDGQGGAYTLYTISGVPREAFSRFPMPRGTDLFGPTFRNEGVVRLDDVTRDPRFGRNAPYHGMPEGHLPVRSYMAVSVVSRSGEVLGGLFFGHPDTGVFDDADERLVVGIAAQAAVAIDNARLYRELREAKDDADAANRAKTQFLAVLSHELRTPLNPILLAASSMLDRPCNPEEIRPTLEMVRQNVNLQARLIDDLLDVMRIVQGKMPLHCGVSDCHALIRRAVEICRSEVHGRGHRLTLDLAAGAHCVNADPARLQQVLWNLVKNAVKFTPEGGTIAVRTRNVNAPDERIVIEVADTGIGIEPEVLPTIWDPFQQGETTITRRFGGLGLGLAICKGVVDAHGGTLEVESPGAGLGTTFRVALRTVPTSGGGDCNSEEDEAPPPSPAPSLNRLRILLVEDEAATLRLMSRLMVGLGHRVTAAGTVADAWAAFEGGEFDLIVSDIGLPDGTGLDLMRKVKSVRRVIPAIALTGYGMDEDIRRSREAGFTTHMTKPIDFTKLEAMIRQVAG